MVEIGRLDPPLRATESGSEPFGFAPIIQPLALGTGKGYFDTYTSGLPGFVVKGTMLQLITLGIYRFWYTTRLRQEMWGRSGIAGERFEYTGTAFELFVGFLLFVGVFLPIYGLSFLGSLQLGLVSEISAVAAPCAFVFMLVLASYRARRFRLSRTLYRGIRFGQSGSALGYALRWLGWMLVTLATLGLAFPAMRAALERYRVGNTWYGDRAFSSAARAPWKPYLVAYALWSLPLIIVIGIMLRSGYSLSYLMLLVTTRGADWVLLLPRPYSLPISLVQIWLIVAPALFYPFYRASEIRRFIGAASFGKMRFESRFSAGTIWAGWLIVAIYLVVYGSAVFIGSAILHGLKGPNPTGLEHETEVVVIGYAILIGGYIVWTIARTLHLHLRVWHMSLTTLTLTGLQEIDEVGARASKSGAFGDDFASSYDFGGL